MRFNSVKRGNFSGLARSVNRATDQVFEAGRSTSVDHSAIAKEAIKGRSMERRAAMEAEGKVARAGLEAVSKTKQYGMKADAIEKEGKRKGQKARMAGVVGALGSLATGVVTKKYLDRQEARDDERDKETKAWQERMLEAYSKPLPEPPEVRKPPVMEYPDLEEPGSSSSTSSVSSDGGGKSQSIGEIPSTLTGNHKIVADAIAGPESGDWGYDAFNQGGAKNGTQVLGKRGSHAEHFGTPLTEMTLSDIFYRQNTKSRGLSFQQHLDSGGLHAVGRYQFIGSTLQDEVRRMGLDPKTTKFTPQVQDKIFFSHLKRVGNISPWVGPMTKYSPEKRSYLNGLIPTL